MKRYGLIGRKLDYSFSPAYFARKFEEEGIEECSYEAFELAEISDVQELLDSGVAGLNVTIPYKEAIIPYLDDLSDEAAEIGAVNTVVFNDGVAIGHNTDVVGFSGALDVFLKELRPKALVLGTGGAAKAVCHVLSKRGIAFTSVSRTRQQDMITWSEVSPECMAEHQLIINCTPLGLPPNIDDRPPLPYDSITEDHIAFDLIYNPSPSAFLKAFKQRGARTMDGNAMLMLQAEASWNLWQSSDS